MPSWWMTCQCIDHHGRDLLGITDQRGRFAGLPSRSHWASSWQNLHADQIKQFERIHHSPHTRRASRSSITLATPIGPYRLTM